MVWQSGQASVPSGIQWLHCGQLWTGAGSAIDELDELEEVVASITEFGRKGLYSYGIPFPYRPLPGPTCDLLSSATQTEG